LYAIAKDLGIEVDTKLVITGPNRKVFIPPDLNKLRLAPWTGDYRGISEAQWLSLGAMKWYDTYIDQETQEEKLSAERILLPIYQNGMLVSYTGRRLDDSKMAKYKNYEFAPAGEILYMHNCIQPTWPVVLVEGPLDAIKYQLNQIPAVGLMGSQNWSDYKLKLLLSTCPSTVWLSMDGDAAGQTAQKEYFNLLKKYVDVQVINIPNGVDPFELEQSLIEDIKNGIWARFYEKVPQHA
jgi:DNA primase